MTLRVVFMGTPDFSVPTLSEIVGAGHAERLIRAAACEGVEHGAVEALLKKVLHQQPVAIGNG